MSKELNLDTTMRTPLHLLIQLHIYLIICLFIYQLFHLITYFLPPSWYFMFTIVSFCFYSMNGLRLVLKSGEWMGILRVTPCNTKCTQSVPYSKFSSIWSSLRFPLRYHSFRSCHFLRWRNLQFGDQTFTRHRMCGWGLFSRP